MSTPFAGYQQDQTYTAAQDRQIQAVGRRHTATMIAADGVIPGPLYTNMEISGAPGMGVYVRPGYAMVAGYSVVVPATQTVTPDPSTTAARRDLVVLRVYDLEQGDVDSHVAVEIIKGSSTADPVIPVRCLLLGQVDIAANATEPVLVDRRTFTNAAGGVQPYLSQYPITDTTVALGTIVNNITTGRSLQRTPTGFQALSRHVAHGTWTDVLQRDTGVWLPLLLGNTAVLPYPAGTVLVNGSVSLAPAAVGGSVAGNVKLYWNNVVLGQWTFNTNGYERSTFNYHTAVADQVAGSYGFCFISVEPTAGGVIRTYASEYSWVALG